MTRRWLCDVAVLAALACLATACSSSNGHPDASPASAPARTSSSPSPTTSELPKGVLASIPLPCCGPSFPVAAFGSLWVPSHRGTQISRIDPRRDKVLAAIDVGDEGCATTPVATPEVLIVDCPPPLPDVEIAPRTNEVVGTLPEHVVAYGFGTTWGVSDDVNALERTNLSTLRVTVVRRMDVGPIAFTKDEAWVLNVDEAGSGYIESGIVRIDSRTNRALGTIHIPDPGYNPNIVAAYGAMWVKGADNAVLVRVDVRTLEVTTYKLPGYEVPTDGGDDSPVAGAGSIWMRLNADWIARIAPDTGKMIGRVPSDGLDTGATIQFAFGSLWIASFDGGFLRRDRIYRP